MTLQQDMYDVIEATRPAANISQTGNWIIRQGAGGGQRVSSATANGPVGDGDIPAAEQAMRALGQDPLFMLHHDDTALDGLLAARGYLFHDPVLMYHCPIETLTALNPARLAAFPVWPPLEIVREIWTENGIGPGRQAVMERAQGPKTAILARHNDRAAGCAYVAIHGKTAMLHALEVVPEQRRQGVANNIMGCAAIWAQNQGATSFSVICVRENSPANALYTSLGMKNVGYYHYRKTDPKRASQV
jgi:GNAT superfamily N-acetyltransferase